MIDSGGEQFCVVVNDEEQYSVWFADQPPPAGWRKTGFEGERPACLAHIEAVWTDMRPASLRQEMAFDDRPHWATAATI